MSVSKEIYIIYGQELDYKIISNNYEILHNQNLIFPLDNKSPIKRCGILFDVMCGKYCIAGICLGVDSSNESLNITLDKLHESDYLNTVDDFFITHIDDTYATYKREFKIFIISHYH